MENFYARIESQFPESLSVIFGIQKEEKDWHIARRPEGITASWFGDQYGPSWNVNLTAQGRRLKEGGEICAEVSLKEATPWDGIGQVPEVPTCELPVPAVKQKYLLIRFRRQEGQSGRHSSSL
jgi:hypothetical protein